MTHNKVFGTHESPVLVLVVRTSEMMELEVVRRAGAARGSE